MANPNVPTTPTNLDTGVPDAGEPPASHAPIDERVQKQLDKFLYGGGRRARKRSGTF